MRNLGGTVDTAQTCHVHTGTPDYTLDFSFPVDYPDQQPVTDFLTQRRDAYLDWVAGRPPRPYPYELDVIGRAYRSGSPTSGTRSLVLTIGSDLGVHPVTSFQSFTYDLTEQAPVTFDTLFKPGAQPRAVLDPIVQRELDTRGTTGSRPIDDDPSAYQSFAITDDAIIFFFDQDGLLPHEAGSFQVSVPRTELATLLG